MTEESKNRNTAGVEGEEFDVLDFDQIVEIQKSAKLFESGIDEEYLARFNAFFDPLSSEYFSVSELVFLGPFHSGDHKCRGLNRLPPESLWNNLLQLVPALNAIRQKLEEPIALSSIYRGPQYNKCVGGVEDSQHLIFSAADCVPKGGHVAELHKAAVDVRNEGVFSGGIGLYNTFVHIDVRGENVDWVKAAT